MAQDWNMANTLIQAKETMLNSVIEAIQRASELGTTMTPGAISEFVASNIVGSNKKT